MKITISQFEKELAGECAAHQRAIDMARMKRDLYRYLTVFDDIREEDRVAIAKGQRGWQPNGKFCGSGFSDIECEIITEKYGWVYK